MNKIKLTTISLVLWIAAICGTSAINRNHYKLNDLKDSLDTSLPCVQMYYSIEECADSFDIPTKYLYGIAYYETGYRGPFHTKYDHALASQSGALGPMQIMLGTAKGIHGKTVSAAKLRSDIRFNVMTSTLLLRKLHNKYKDWLVVFGAYNTGRPCVNSYAKKVYNFEPNWYEQLAKLSE